jgi:hypothetical protein
MSIDQNAVAATHANIRLSERGPRNRAQGEPTTKTTFVPTLAAESTCWYQVPNKLTKCGQNAPDADKKANQPGFDPNVGRNQAVLEAATRPKSEDVASA